MEKCRACSNSQRNKQIGIHVYWCGKCGAVFGTCYLGESYEFVRPYFSKKDVPPDRIRYYDFTTLGSVGIDRRHGWFDPKTKLIIQIG